MREEAENFLTQAAQAFTQLVSAWLVANSQDWPAIFLSFAQSELPFVSDDLAEFLSPEQKSVIQESIDSLTLPLPAKEKQLKDLANRAEAFRELAFESSPQATYDAAAAITDGWNSLVDRLKNESHEFPDHLEQAKSDLVCNLLQVAIAMTAGRLSMAQALESLQQVHQLQRVQLREVQSQAQYRQRILHKEAKAWRDADTAIAQTLGRFMSGVVGTISSAKSIKQGRLSNSLPINNLILIETRLVKLIRSRGFKK